MTSAIRAHTTGNPADGHPHRPGIAQLVDSLSAGGTERVAVNLANLLPQDRFHAYLCTTRAEGPLAKLVAPHVTRLQLARRGRIDFTALRRFVSFVRHHDICLIHAHATSLFFGRLAGMLAGVPVVWHDHYGRCELNDRPVWLYRLAARKIAGVIAVNHALLKWSRESLEVPAEHTHYVPNLVEFAVSGSIPPELPGQPGQRIVCVANLRPQKDHLTLLRAMSIARQYAPSAHLLLIGSGDDPVYLKQVRAEIDALGLADVVSYLGPREDVPAILRASDIGVLSSCSEGLPLALLEYGRAGLAVAVTNVGQCSEVVDGGNAGILVPPAQPELLGGALIQLLTSVQRRLTLGRIFQERVESTYDAGPIIDQICNLYGEILREAAEKAN